MQPGEHIFDQRTFDDQSLKCIKCGWAGKGSEATINEEFGPGKFKQVTCPQCDEPMVHLDHLNVRRNLLPVFCGGAQAHTRIY